METIRKTIRIALGVVTTAAVLMGAAALHADPESARPTNGIVGVMNLNSYPTNSPTTNAAGTSSGVATGKAIGVGNYKSVGFYFRAQPIVTNWGDFTNFFTLVRAHSSSPPTVIMNTNGNGFTIYSDFDVSNYVSFQFVQRGGSNYVMWSTNLSDQDIGGANYAGVLCYSNNASATMVETNVDWGFDKKILPIKFPN